MGLRYRLGGYPRRLVVLVLAGFLTTAPGARAQGPDVFTVTGVAVDAKAETAAAAREIALAEGQRQAYRMLLERMTLRADYGRHPRLGQVELTSLVRGIEFEEEKASSVRYIAKLIITFKKREVRNLLRGAELRYSETVSKPILVLPVYESAGAFSLWDDLNPWREAWRTRERRRSLVPLLLPTGDLADVGAISPSQALAGDTARLAAIAYRYGVDDTIVARAAFSVDLATSTPRLEVSLNQFGPSGERTIIESFVGATRDDVGALLERAVAEITVELEETWKRETLLRFDRANRLSARVPLKRLADWLAVRERLGSVSLVRSIELDGLSKSSAQVILHYLGDPEQLAISLVQHDIELIEEGGFFILRLRAATSRPATSAAGRSTAE
jgi:hypothetical protein